MCLSQPSASPTPAPGWPNHREERVATPHHHPLPIEGRPQPARLRSVARTARKPPRTAREVNLTAEPAAPAVYRARLGSASSARVSHPAQVSRLCRLPFAAGAHAGCAVCPSQRAHTQPPLWARPAESVTARSGVVPRSGAHSATADGLLHVRGRPRVVVGCGSPCGPHVRAFGSPARPGLAAAPRSRLRRHRGSTCQRRTCTPSPGSRRACAGSQPPSAPAPRALLQGSGTRPLPRPLRGRRSGRVPRLGIPFFRAGAAVACSCGGARTPAPRPRLRFRSPNRLGSRESRSRLPGASRSPRPRRTT